MKRQFALVALIILLTATGFTFNGWRSQVAEGNKNYENGQLDSAVSAYQQALIEAPDEPVVHYNLGSALYTQGDYAGAQEQFSKTLESEDTTLHQQAEYNLGNVKYREGTGLQESSPGEAINSYKAALQHYQNAMKADPSDLDAKFNYELVKKKLQELEDKLENQEQDNQSNDSSDGQNEEQDENGQEQDQNDQGQENQQGSQDDQGQTEEQKGEEDQSGADEQQSGENQESQSEESGETAGAEEGEEGEELQGLTQAQALQLLEQFEDQVGQWIPVPMEEESGQPRKDW